ncbi:hypothetical protein MaudCBS49596_003915 [Microsporum audouinii]
MTRSLSYETGGILPDRFFSRFRYDKPLSPEAFKGAHKIIDRWSDVHELDKEFSFLKVKYYLSNGICLSASEEVNGDWKYIDDRQIMRTWLGLTIVDRYCLEATAGNKNTERYKQRSLAAFASLYYGRGVLQHDRPENSQSGGRLSYRQVWASFKRFILNNCHRVLCIMALVLFRVISSLTKKAARDMYGKLNVLMIIYLVGEAITWLGLSLQLCVLINPRCSSYRVNALVFVCSIIGALTDCAALIYLGKFDTYKRSNQSSLVFKFFSEAGVHVLNLYLLVSVNRATPNSTELGVELAEWYEVPGSYRAWALENLMDLQNKYRIDQVKRSETLRPGSDTNASNSRQRNSTSTSQRRRKHSQGSSSRTGTPGQIV